jgi:hypothetical protein
MGSCEQNPIKFLDFLDWLSEYSFLKKVCARWT